MGDIPRWLELQAEIDYRVFLLNEMRREVAPEDERLTPLERMIDKATGLDEKRLAEAEEIIAEIKTLKAEWDALAITGTGEEPGHEHLRLPLGERRRNRHLLRAARGARRSP